MLEGLPIVASAAAAGESSLTVQPIKRALSVGDRLQFGDNTVVVSDVVARGETTIPLSNTLTYALTAADANLTGYKITNLTGYTVASMIREDWSSATPLAAFTCTVDDALNGIVLIVLEKDITSALEPNIDEKTAISLDDDGLQRRNRTVNKKGLPDDYVWDLELTTPSDKVSRVIQGVVLVSGEATR